MAAITDTNMQRYMDSKDVESNKIFGEIEEIEDDVDRNFNAFTNFATIQHPPSDHHYLNHRLQGPIFFNWGFSKSSFRQRMEQECGLLGAFLPGSPFFVRAYEERIDLMRAAVMGPKHTPYHHCLFFFDIYFPPNYPQTPPKFHYISYGVDLNPHLQLDGKVSVSLLQKQQQERIGSCCLNNWSGGGSILKKRWNPNQSNVLKVFDAIQHAVFSSVSPPTKCEEERVFAAACEKMIKVLRQPPMDFGDLLVGHLRKRAHRVLLKFREKGYDGEEMKKLFAALMEAFEQTTGAYCKHHLDFLRSTS